MFKCSFCERSFDTKIGAKTHEYRCKNNPLHEENAKKYSETIKRGLSKKPKATKYFKYTSNCQKCGKEFTQFTTERLIASNKHRRCCSSICAHSRNHTDETKNKTRNSLNEYYSKHNRSRVLHGTKLPIDLSNIKNWPTSAFQRYNNRSKEIQKHKCVFCGKEIYGKFKNAMYCYECAEEHNMPNLMVYTKEGKAIPSKKRIEASRTAQLKLIAEGKHKGWQSRNITSYPENFWKEVLKNNNIEYSFNHVVSKHDLGLDDKSNYFLDFLLPGNIDLEIDGKQHKYKDRAESDKIRDELLKANGYNIYRIEWNEVSSERGKLLMKEKIDNFLNYYNSINIK